MCCLETVSDCVLKYVELDFFGFLPLPTVTGYDKTCQEKNVSIP